MLLLFKEQLFRPNSLLNQPLVGLPFADSLVCGFLLAADHSHRNALTRDEQLAAPRTIRIAVEIIEEEAHLPLTVASIAARSHVSVRSLQQGFRRHMGTSPIAYLREVRLRQAHQSLLESDPSTTSVASVAYHWGFTNLGRFALRIQPAMTSRRRPRCGAGRFAEVMPTSLVASDVLDQLHDYGRRGDPPSALVGELGVNDCRGSCHGQRTCGGDKRAACPRPQVIHCHRQRWAPVARHEGAAVRRCLIKHFGDTSTAEAHEREGLGAGSIRDLQNLV